MLETHVYISKSRVLFDIYSFLGRSRAGSLWDPWDRNLFDPWVPVSRIWDVFDHGSALDSPTFSFSRHAQAIANTKLDCKETPEAHVFTADLPGLKKEELKIELVDNGSLRISGERHKEDVQETDQWHRVERSSGRFMRQFRLPDNVNAYGISAKLENGVLTVNAPKIKPAVVSNGDAKPIEISANDKSKGAIVIRDLGLSQVQMLENNCGHLVS